MSAKKPARKRRRPSQAAAARAERKEKKTLTWKKVKFELPENLPKGILFDFIEIEAAAGSADPAPSFRMLLSIVGPQQFRRVRYLVEQGKAEPADVFDLVQKILAKYGVNGGK